MSYSDSIKANMILFWGDGVMYCTVNRQISETYFYELKPKHCYIIQLIFPLPKIINKYKILLKWARRSSKMLSPKSTLPSCRHFLDPRGWNYMASWIYQPKHNFKMVINFDIFFIEKSSKTSFWWDTCNNKIKYKTLFSNFRMIV